MGASRTTGEINGVNQEERVVLYPPNARYRVPWPFRNHGALKRAVRTSLYVVVAALVEPIQPARGIAAMQRKSFNVTQVREIPRCVDGNTELDLPVQSLLSDINFFARCHCCI